MLIPASLWHVGLVYSDLWNQTHAYAFSGPRFGEIYGLPSKRINDTHSDVIHHCLWKQIYVVYNPQYTPDCEATCLSELEVAEQHFNQPLFLPKDEPDVLVRYLLISIVISLMDMQKPDHSWNRLPDHLSDSDSDIEREEREVRNT